MDTGTYDLRRENHRFQFYWLEVKWTGNELFIGADTCFRIVRRPKYFGIGFKVLGFGIGFDTWVTDEVNARHDK